MMKLDICKCSSPARWRQPVHKHDRRGWQKCLEEYCAELKGHRVVWRKDADPYRVKLVRSVIRTKQLEKGDGSFVTKF